MTAAQGLTGHVARATGGSSGIGLGMARGLRKAVAAVAIWGTNAQRRSRGGAGGVQRPLSAGGGTRTLTLFRAMAPKAIVYANFTTPA